MSNASSEKSFCFLDTDTQDNNSETKMSEEVSDKIIENTANKIIDDKIIENTANKIIDENKKLQNLITLKDLLIKEKMKNFQHNLVKKLYLSDLRNWPIFNLLKSDFMPRIHTVMAYCWENTGIIVTEDKIVYEIGYTDKCSKSDDIPFYPRKIEKLCGKNIKTFAHSSSCILALIEEGKVYSWEFKIKEPVICTRIAGLSDKRIVDIACGDGHFLALTSDGKVYAWGENNCGQIGNNSTQFCHERKPWQVKPTLENKDVVQIACGLKFNMVLTDDHELYGWGDNEHMQILVHTFNYYNHMQIVNLLFVYPCKITITTSPIKIVKVACGYQHTLVLTDKGEVYAFGRNNYGQLGIDINVKLSSSVMVDVPSIVVDIAACGDTSVAVDSHKIIYVWGDCFGQNIITPISTEFSRIHDVFAHNRIRVMHEPVTVSTDDYEYIKKLLNVVESLETAFNDPSTSDFTVQVRGQPIHVHKAVLQIRSQYFRNKFQWDLTEINQSKANSTLYTVSDKYSYFVYKAFLKYLYTNTVDVPPENVIELLKLADEYCEASLKEDFSQLIKQAITKSNVAFFYNKAIECNAKELEDFCFQFALRHMKAVVLSEEYSKLDLRTRNIFMRRAAEENAFRT